MRAGILGGISAVASDVTLELVELSNNSAGQTGGGVMLDQLTAAGMNVVALQRGPELRPADFTDDELETFWRGNVFAPDQLEPQCPTNRRTTSDPSS